MASHQREPIKHSCPEIDKYIKSIKRAIVDERYLNNMDQDELIETANNMANELSECIGYLESLRSSNDTLRQWGIEESEKVDELELQLEEVNTKNIF